MSAELYYKNINNAFKELESGLISQGMLLETILNEVKNLPENNKSTFEYENAAVLGMEVYAFKDCIAFHKLSFPKLSIYAPMDVFKNIEGNVSTPSRSTIILSTESLYRQNAAYKAAPASG